MSDSLVIAWGWLMYQIVGKPILKFAKWEEATFNASRLNDK